MCAVPDRPINWLFLMVGHVLVMVGHELGMVGHELVMVGHKLVMVGQMPTQAQPWLLHYLSK